MSVFFLYSGRGQPTSLPPQPSPEKLNIKKHSFGKSTPPPKPKPPSFTHKGSSGSLNGSKENIVKAEPSSTNNATNNQNGSEKSSGAKKSEDLDLDMVLRSDDKLAHLTAERVKAPKRRPPSSGFQKEAVSFLFFFFRENAQIFQFKFGNPNSKCEGFLNGFFIARFFKKYIVFGMVTFRYFLKYLPIF